MQSLKVSRPSEKTKSIKLSASVGVPLLLLLALLSGLQGLAPKQARAASDYPSSLSSISLATINGWDSLNVIDPVVITDSNIYKMWYTGKGLDGKWRIGYATSTDGINWTKYTGNPVLDVGADSTWDSDVVRLNTVTKVGSTYQMWYVGNGHHRIGYATSTDGITWTKYAGNPVLDVGSPSSWDEGVVSFAGVISDSGIYKMWYSGGGISGFGGIIRTGYATSTTGITWTKYTSNPVLDVGPSAWDGFWASDPHVISDGVSYKMWYSGLEGPLCSASEVFRIGLATSTDGISWTKSISNPVLDVNPTGWDSRSATAPWVIFDGNIYHMWYHGGVSCSPEPEMIGYATSTDGISWTKYAGNPVLGPNRLVYLPIVVKS
jgi:predicted GH43/DUF377 family glycosyl hydrolase